MITITLTVSKDAFVNDICMCQVTASRFIRFYNIDEDFKTKNGTVSVHKMLCELIDVSEDGTVVGYSLPNVIGMSNSVFSISTEKPSLEGQLLTMGNIEDCVLEYYDARQ